MSWLRLMEESIQANPDTPVTGETDKVHTHPPGRKHGLIGLIKEMWPAYLIEMVVIILGISITLALEEWRDNRKENQLEQVYLKNLTTDIRTDLNSLRYVANGTREILLRGNELIAVFRYPTRPEFSYSRINADVRAILGRPKFLPSDATFSDLKSSGNLHLLKDIRLKNLLFAYYNQTQNIREMQDAEQLATISLSGNYFLKHFSVADSSAVAPEPGPEEIGQLVKSFEFDNQVSLRVLNRKELMDDYEKADSLAEILKAELEKKTE